MNPLRTREEWIAVAHTLFPLWPIEHLEQYWQASQRPLEPERDKYLEDLE